MREDTVIKGIGWVLTCFSLTFSVLIKLDSALTSKNSASFKENAQCSCSTFRAAFWSRLPDLDYKQCCWFSPEVSTCGKKWLLKGKLKTSTQGLWKEPVSQALSGGGRMETWTRGRRIACRTQELKAKTGGGGREGERHPACEKERWKTLMRRGERSSWKLWQSKKIGRKKGILNNKKEQKLPLLVSPEVRIFAVSNVQLAGTSWFWRLPLFIYLLLTYILLKIWISKFSSQCGHKWLNFALRFIKQGRGIQFSDSFWWPWKLLIQRLESARCLLINCVLNNWGRKVMSMSFLMMMKMKTPLHTCNNIA